ncbi:MAG: hypothetical protein KAG66_07665, partial [Methylococcales bacterium]|nr:hypothetical protein [Methylococcales bacterium]
MRRELGTKIQETENLGNSAGPNERAEISIKIAIKSKQGTDLSSKDLLVSMVGPGDIVGLSKDAIVRVEPEDWITSFEHYHIPFIEFYDEDLPWRYTPAKANAANQLRPWLFLLILKKDEFERLDPLNGPLPSIRLNVSESPFPPVDEAWAWAHVHVNADLDTDSENHASLSGQIQADGKARLEELLKENPDIAVSRILAPRRLKPETDYQAFLIPAFETGRLAGLGKEASEIAAIEAQAASWGAAQTDYPFFHEWYFRTGAAGDFEHLVRQIMPRAMPEGVGMRQLDLTNPGLGISGLTPTAESDGTVGFVGALKVPGVDAEPYAPNGVIEGEWLSLIQGIEAEVNRGYELVE